MSINEAQRIAEAQKAESAKPDSPWKIAGFTALFGVFALGYYSVKNFRKGHTGTGVTCLVLAAVLVCVVSIALSPTVGGIANGTGHTSTESSSAYPSSKGAGQRNTATERAASHQFTQLALDAGRQSDTAYVASAKCIDSDHDTSNCVLDAFGTDSDGDWAETAYVTVSYLSGLMPDSAWLESRDGIDIDVVDEVQHSE